MTITFTDRKIWKYEMQIVLEEQQIVVPKFSDLMEVEFQNSILDGTRKLCAWFCINPNEKEKEAWHFLLAPTGGAMPDAVFFKTLVMNDVWVVLHLFYKSP